MDEKDIDIKELARKGYDSLSPEDKERVLEYWRNTTLEERLQEVQRLRYLVWGEAVFGTMDKTKFEVISRDPE